MNPVMHQLLLMAGFRLVCNSIQLQVLVKSTIISHSAHMTCAETEAHSTGSDGNRLVSWNLPKQTPADRGAKC